MSGALSLGVTLYLLGRAATGRPVPPSDTLIIFGCLAFIAFVISGALSWRLDRVESAAYVQALQGWGQQLQQRIDELESRRPRIRPPQIERDGDDWVVVVRNEGEPGSFEAQIRVEDHQNFPIAVRALPYDGYWARAHKRVAVILTDHEDRLQVGAVRSDPARQGAN